MIAKTGHTPAWPRRNRVAGYARGSASGGAVPILYRTGRKAALCRELIERSRRLPGVRVSAEDGDYVATLRLDSNDAVILRITRHNDLVVSLPAKVLDALRGQCWLAGEAGDAARVHGPRSASELEVASRIVVAAWEVAAAEAQLRAGLADRAAAVASKILVPEELETFATT